MPYYFGPTVIVALVLVILGVIALYLSFRSPGIPAERKATVSKYASLAGFVLIAAGIVTYAWEVLTPISAEKVVRIERSRVALPIDIDALTRWESIEAGQGRVRYMYTVRKSPRNPEGREAFEKALRQQITDSVCQDRMYREASKRQIPFEFIYKFADGTRVTVSPSSCGNVQ